MITKENSQTKPALNLSGRTEPRFFPKTVRFTMQDHTVRIFPAGVQDVPVEIIDSPWLKDNGVVEYEVGKPLPPLMRQAPLGSQAHAAAVGASGVYSAVQVPRQHSEVDPVSDADKAEADVAEAEARLETLRDRARALREVSDKHLDRQAELDRSRGVPANTGENDDDDGQDGTEDARPTDGDINPRTGNPYTPAALEKAQAKWDEKHINAE